MMMRFLIFTCFAFIALMVDNRALHAVDKERMNVLFIAVDDLRTEASVFGNKYIHSPNLERIAKMGITFNRAYCQPVSYTHLRAHET
jgi:hypothetical protein